MKQQNTSQGILLMIAATMVFAAQDGFSRYLAGEYNVLMVNMIRFWAFGAFVVVMAARSPGGLRAAVATRQPKLQIFRGLLLAAQICAAVLSFTLIGLVETHAMFTTAPLMVTALSGPILGEKVGWRRWAAIVVGFCGVLIILQPGQVALSWMSLLPLAVASGFALYSLLTRYVARQDSAVSSFFWTGVGGAAFMTVFGIWFWEPMAPSDWIFMAVLCCVGSLSHFLLIRAYEVAEASAVQPFTYFQLPFIVIIGLFFFDETLRPNVVIGGLIAVGAGLFTLWRERVRARRG